MTTDRKRGPKGDKHFQTRTVGRYGYGSGNFCTLSCQNDWWSVHGTSAVNHFGRIHEPIKMTRENAWIKDYDYHYNQADDNWRFINKLTGEEIPLTQEQYRDTNYTIERAR